MRVDDLLKTTVTVGLFYVLLKQGDQAARQISVAGESFSQMVRAAQDLPPEPTADEKIESATTEFMLAEDETWEEFEQRLDDSLGLSQTKTDRQFYHQGIYGAMFGRKKSIHRGGPKHDPIWGETGE